MDNNADNLLSALNAVHRMIVDLNNALEAGDYLKVRTLITRSHFIIQRYRKSSVNAPRDNLEVRRLQMYGAEDVEILEEMRECAIEDLRALMFDNRVSERHGFLG